MYDLLETPANLTLIRKITNLSVYVERWIDKRTYRVLKFRGHYHSVPGALKDAEIGTLIRHIGKTEGKFHNGNFHDVYDPEFDKKNLILWAFPLILFIFGGILIYRKVFIN